MASKATKKMMAKNAKFLKRGKEIGLSEKQFDEINKAFCVFDQDGNGKISHAELRNVIKSLGRAMSEKDLTDMMRAADSDGSGAIEFNEFLPLIAKEFMGNKGKETNKDTQEAFRCFDQNGDGVITAKEFRIAVAKMGQNLSEQEVADFMKSVDKDGDGVITYEEFVKYMNSRSTLFTTFD